MNELTIEKREELINFIRENRDIFVKLLKEVREDLRFQTLINTYKLLSGKEYE